MKLGILPRSAAWAAALVLAGGIALAAKNKSEEHAGVRPPLHLQIETAPIDRSAPAPISFAPVVKRAEACVVAVTTSKKVQTGDMSQMSPLFNDPMFRHFFGIPEPGEGGGGGGGGGWGRHPHESIQQSLGSGVIVSSDGYILTNNHVVEGADDVKIKLGPAQKEYKATVVGRDPEADVAVLKIDATGLPAATIGDSDQLQVGDTVLAVGDPFGVGLSVTHGIVSALGRKDLEIEAYEDFIQTDAPINPGNSGGALVDVRGRLVGINTAIFSHSGGSNGVGFAIPINLVRSVAEQLIAHGRVARGYLGVMLQDLNPDLSAQFGTSSGALVTDVEPNTPAAKAGLVARDIITRFNGKAVESVSQLHLAVAAVAPGTDVTVEYLRDGKASTVTIKLGELPSKSLAGGGNDHTPGGNNEGVLNGVTVGDITPELREQLQLPTDLQGAVITEVDPDSASAQAGLARGDVIRDLNGKAVHNADEAVKLSEDIKGPKVMVRVYRGGSSRYVVVDESPKP